MDQDQIVHGSRTAFVFLACFILAHGLFGQDVLKHKALIFADTATRLMVLNFIYRIPTS